MKIFIDTEFYERPMSAMGAGTIGVQLISLGAVREDGAEFYAENADFNWDFVPGDHWLQANVRPHLDGGNFSEESWSHRGGNWSPKLIAQQFYEFACTYALHPSGVATPENVKPEFWGYFCDYDWVVLCGLYGRMVDLPSEFPMYCLDLKQEMRAKERDTGVEVERPTQSLAHHALSDARWNRDLYERIVW